MTVTDVEKLLSAIAATLTAFGSAVAAGHGVGWWWWW
jgi:hypothetical protein